MFTYEKTLTSFFVRFDKSEQKDIWIRADLIASIEDTTFGMSMISLTTGAHHVVKGDSYILTKLIIGDKNEGKSK